QSQTELEEKVRADPIGVIGVRDSLQTSKDTAKESLEGVGGTKGLREQKTDKMREETGLKEEVANLQKEIDAMKTDDASKPAKETELGNKKKELAAVSTEITSITGKITEQEKIVDTSEKQLKMLDTMEQKAKKVVEELKEGMAQAMVRLDVLSSEHPDITEITSLEATLTLTDFEVVLNGIDIGITIGGDLRGGLANFAKLGVDIDSLGVNITESRVTDPTKFLTALQALVEKVRAKTEEKPKPAATT
ncbi:MAG: hypothetical protein WCX61_03790, partial [Candidatus Peribacteraceae bacterium]